MKNAYIKNLSGTKCDAQIVNQKLWVSGDRVGLISITWEHKFPENTLVLGDAWERSYGDLCFRPVNENHNAPWYFIAQSGNTVLGVGVKTGANAFVNFTYNETSVTALIDARCGSEATVLGGRKICLCEFVFKEYSDVSSFEAAKDFCREMCDKPLLPQKPIYGGNDFYYYYGHSTAETIVQNASFIGEMSKGFENRPYMVVDDGWETTFCTGPWTVNDKFRDMKKLAKNIKNENVLPGIWVRFLCDKNPIIPDWWRIERNGKKEFLDPSVPDVLDYISQTIGIFRAWGYRMIKHDFSTVDMFGHYGFEITDTITKIDNWHFADTSRTSAEIVKEYYKTILAAAGKDMTILGCNTIPHLIAGYAHCNRIGDDTSGREWARTKKMGINTLAYRMVQHDTFYSADADCVGTLSVPWEKNVQWLKMLALSGTALFISTNDAELTPEMKSDIRGAFELAQKGEMKLTPLEWGENLTPERWLCDGKEIKFDFGD